MSVIHAEVRNGPMFLIGSAFSTPSNGVCVGACGCACARTLGSGAKIAAARSATQIENSEKRRVMWGLREPPLYRGGRRWISVRSQYNRPSMSRAVLVLSLAALISWPVAQAQSGWELVVLGRAQDAGIPQLGCTQAACVDRREGRKPAERVASLGLRNTRTGQSFLFDATPDLPSQLHMLNGGRVPDGIFLTHGHVGHYTGLMYLGRESINASKAPVFGTSQMAAYLSSNGPWVQLVSLNNIVVNVIEYDRPVLIGDGVKVTAF